MWALISCNNIKKFELKLNLFIVYYLFIILELNFMNSKSLPSLKNTSRMLWKGLDQELSMQDKITSGFPSVGKITHVNR